VERRSPGEGGGRGGGVKAGLKLGEVEKRCDGLGKNGRRKEELAAM